jgi:hypothetical protein
MSDLRELLDVAAGDVHEIPNVKEFIRSGRPFVWKRRAAYAMGILLVAFGSWAAKEQLFVESSLPPAEVNEVPAESLALGELEPGRYSATSFEIPLRFDIDYDRWTVASIQPTWIQLRVDATANVNIQIWDRVYDAGSGSRSSKALLPLPSDLVAWLQSNRNLEVSNVAEVTTAGLRGTRVDLRVRSTLAYTPSECGLRPCILIARVEGTGETVDLQRGEAARCYIFEVEDHRIVVMMHSDRDFDHLSEETDRLVATMEPE